MPLRLHVPLPGPITYTKTIRRRTPTRRSTAPLLRPPTPQNPHTKWMSALMVLGLLVVWFAPVIAVLLWCVVAAVLLVVAVGRIRSER